MTIRKNRLVYDHKAGLVFEGGQTMEQQKYDPILEQMNEQRAKDAAAAETRYAEICKENTFTILGHTICLIPDEQQINAAFKKARETVRKLEL